MVTVVTALKSLTFFCHHYATEVVTGGDRRDRLVQAALLVLFSGAAGTGVVPADVTVGIEGDVRFIPEGRGVLFFSEFLIELPEIFLRIAMP